MSNDLLKHPIVTQSDSKKSGPTVIIMAGVHGNEKGGVLALKEAKNKIDIQKGKVYWIIANPGAIKSKKRYLDMNLNRAFKAKNNLNKFELTSYERGLAEQIMFYLDEGDALLDLHSVHTSPATPFLVCEPKSYGIARKMPFHIVSSGWEKIHPGSTDEYMSKQDKIGICAECGQHDEIETKKRALYSIHAFLSCMGNIESDFCFQDSHHQQIVKPRFIYRCKVDFIPVRKYPDFTVVRKGEFLGTDGGQAVTAPFTGMIVFMVECDEPESEAFVMAV